MIKAKYFEIRGLINRDIFRAIPRTDLLDGVRKMTARCFLAIKSDEDKEERCEARYVVGGHLNIMKD